MSGGERRCIICARTNKIITEKDETFEKIIKNYWQTGLLDVKPKDFYKYDFCKKCYGLCGEMYDANEMVRALRNHIQDIQIKMHNSTCRSIDILKEDGVPIQDVHNKALEKGEVKRERIGPRLESSLRDSNSDD